ncbi:CASP2 [Branchiostoma lanceolatum]|uniref:CASP2 protein n=1 Tax=Branchiostoma lanceolatum TaxID=7740 RepID=A0A8J9YQY0_BRALA|nr:CASP2 [Branchiostoma lanceolatum]
MANLSRYDLFLKISDNLQKREARNLRNYVSHAGILGEALVEDANPHEIFQQMDKEKKLELGDLSLLADILRKIRRHDFAVLAEEVAANEREASKLKNKTRESSGSSANGEPEPKRTRLSQFACDDAQATTSDNTMAYASSSSGFQQTDDDDQGDGPINVVVEPCTDEMWAKIVREGIKDEVRRFTERKDHKDAEGSIVVLMSHGEEGKIYGTDGQLVALEVIFAMFDENICLRLKGKPKLFFIQACRGNKVYRGPSSAPEDEADSSWETVNLDLMGELKGLLGRTSLGQDEGDAPQPEQRPHVFCGYATRLGYLSFRNTADGSWFIHAITSVFMKNAKDKSLVEMMDKVKENLLTRKANSSDPKFQGGREESVYLSSLQKDLYFFPGQ